MNLSANALIGRTSGDRHGRIPDLAKFQLDILGDFSYIDSQNFIIYVSKNKEPYRCIFLNPEGFASHGRTRSPEIEGVKKSEIIIDW